MPSPRSRHTHRDRAAGRPGGSSVASARRAADGRREDCALTKRAPPLKLKERRSFPKSLSLGLRVGPAWGTGRAPAPPVRNWSGGCEPVCRTWCAKALLASPRLAKTVPWRAHSITRDRISGRLVPAAWSPERPQVAEACPVDRTGSILRRSCRPRSGQSGRPEQPPSCRSVASP